MTTIRGLRLVALTTAFACCGAGYGHAQTTTGPASDEMAMPADLGAPLASLQGSGAPSAAPAGGADDMAMPDDLGAPLAGTEAAAPDQVSGHRQVLSVNMPIAQIAASPKGKAVLEKTLPGLCERAEFPMFKGMSLARLAGLSNGRITNAKLDAVQADLTRLGPVDAAGEPSHGMFYPLTHTAAYSIHYGGQQIGRFSHALYHRVVLVVAAM